MQVGGSYNTSSDLEFMDCGTGNWGNGELAIKCFVVWQKEADEFEEFGKYLSVV